MEHLWTPWRMAYIRTDKKPQGCIFCNMVNSEDDATDHILHRSEHVFVVLNRYPYNTGHMMVVPYEHSASQEDLAPDVLMDMMLTTNRAITVARDVYKPQGFNLGANIGAASGAGIAEHYHFHIVPRWSGDTNFATVVSSTRVIPDELTSIYADLTAAWHKRFPEQS